MKNQLNKFIKSKILLTSLLLGCSQQIFAAPNPCATTPYTLTLTSDSTTPINDTGNACSITIDTGVALTIPVDAAIILTGNGSTVINNGSVGAVASSSTLSGSISVMGGSNVSITNNATISGLDSSTGINNGFVDGTIENDVTSHITTINNNVTGVIRGPQAVLINGVRSTIDNITNLGQISGSFLGVVNFGIMKSLTNLGEIASAYPALYNIGTITTLTNNGAIYETLGTFLGSVYSVVDSINTGFLHLITAKAEMV